MIRVSPRAQVVGWHGVLPSLQLMAALPLACFAITLLVSELARRAEVGIVLWPAGGILLAALLRHQPRLWPTLALLAASADLGANQLAGAGLPQALALAAIDAGEALLAAGLLRQGRARLDSVQDVLLFAAAVILAAALSALARAGLVEPFALEGFAQAWWAWFPAKVLGLLIVTPFLLSWSDPALRGEAPWSRLEAAGLAGLVLLVAVLVFTQGTLLYGPLVFPVLLLATLRTGLPGASAGTVVLALASMASAPGAAEAVASLQLYLAAVLLSILLVTTALADLRAGRRRAEAADHAKSDFLAIMSHEIRTPLSTLLGTVDLFSGETLSAGQKHRLKTISSSGQHLLRVVNDVLTFAKLDARAMELEHVAFRLDEVVEEVVSITAEDARQRGLELVVEAGAGVPPLSLGDPTRIRQVLLNLVGNALKFTHTGRITIRLGGEPMADGGTRVRLAVQDSGIGMTPEEQRRLFRPFAQANAATERHYGGTGLGLAICKRFVEAMGGRIGVDSELGRGSTFWVELPLEPAPLASAAAASGLRRAGPPLRILVAEDMAASRVLLKEMLGRHGHAVTLVNDGPAALVAAAGGGFDLVLMDLLIPGLDGLETARRIRRLPAPAGQVPILALTASVIESTRQRCIEAGMEGLVTKPINWPQFLDLLAGFKPAQAVTTLSARAPFGNANHAAFCE